jgi:hypothetical protein
MSLGVLPAAVLNSNLPLASEFCQHGCQSFRQAAEYVQDLPYARNSGSPAYKSVLADRRGTCSSKHAIVAALSHEQSLTVQLILGIYEMDEVNTPGIGRVLNSAGLLAIPEAHCWVEYNGSPVDLTSGDAQSQFNNRVFVHREEISPEQTGTYKEKAHKGFISSWLAGQPHIEMNERELWEVRERCIAALSES